MVMNPVAIMKPPMRPTVFDPTLETIVRAMRLWRFHFCMARASMKPPMNRKIVSDP